MFKKLFRNVYLPIVAIAVALILFIDVFSIIMISQTMKDAYNSMDNKRISRAYDSCELYISSVSASTFNLSLNDTLVGELKNPTDKSLTNVLDDTCNYSLKINGVCAYSAQGAVYTSSGISQAPALNELMQNEAIKNFIEGDDDSFISFRTDNIAGIYNNVSYPDEMGVITCCKKVYDGERVIGWLFSDILPSNLYDILLSQAQFGNAVAFITFDNSYFDYAGNSAHENLLAGDDGGYFSYAISSDEELFTLTVFNSAKEYRTRITLLTVILLSVSAALIAGVHFAATFTAKSVTKRLEKLSAKMNAQKIA